MDHKDEYEASRQRIESVSFERMVGVEIVYICQVCYAMIDRRYREIHAEWHEEQGHLG